MKKIISFVMIVIMAFSLVGCKEGDKTPVSSDNNSSVSESLSETLSDNEISYSKGWEKTRLSEFKIENLTLYLSAKSKYERTAHILMVKSTEEKSGPRNSYLAIETENKVILKELGPAIMISLDYRDVNGDNEGEAIVNQCVDMFGGAGQYKGYVFDADDSGIKQLYNSMDVGFDNGFRGETVDGFKIRITNEKTGYKEDFDTGYRYVESHFKANGKPIEKNTVRFDSFYKFEPKDQNNDTVYEIKCSQYTSFYSHTDGIGTAVSYLTFDKNSGKFVVSDAYFEWNRGDFVYSDWQSTERKDYTIYNGTANYFSEGKYKEFQYPIFNSNIKEILINSNDILARRMGDFLSHFGNGSKEQTAEVKYEITFENKRYISILFSGYRYEKGAAHPTNETLAITIDLKNGAELLLSDIVWINNDFAKTVKAEWKKQTPEEMHSYIDSIEDDEFKEKIQGFYFSEKNIVLIMDTPHAVAAYNRITIPLSSLGY